MCAGCDRNAPFSQFRCVSASSATNSTFDPPELPEAVPEVMGVNVHQSLCRERPLCPVLSSSFVRSVSTPSSKPLLVLSACLSDVAELAQAFSSQQLAFRRKFASKLFHFSCSRHYRPCSLLPISLCCWMNCRARVLFCASHCPSDSTWSRARNSKTEGPPPSRSRLCPLGIGGLNPMFLRHVHVHNQAVEFCFMALEMWLKYQSGRPFLLVAPEDYGGNVGYGPSSLWQLAEAVSLGSRAHDVARGSASACELRAAEFPRPMAFLCNLRHMVSQLTSGWPEFPAKGPFLDNVAGAAINTAIFAAPIRQGRSSLEPKVSYQNNFGPEFYSGVSPTTVAFGTGCWRVKKFQGQRQVATGDASNYGKASWIKVLAESPESFRDEFNVFISRFRLCVHSLSSVFSSPASSLLAVSSAASATGWRCVQNSDETAGCGWWSCCSSRRRGGS